MSQNSLLTSISSKKNIIIRALLLAIYKSQSNVADIQVISKLFFVMFVPYAVSNNENKNEILNYLDEIEEIDEIESVLMKAIDIDNSSHQFNMRPEIHRDSQADSENDRKDLSTLLIEELNILVSHFKAILKM